MYTVLVIVQVVVAIGLIVLVLLQQGKGADAGAAFGSGSSGTVFGSRGAANFLSRSTAWLAAAFFGTSLALAYVVHGQAGPKSIVDSIKPASSVIELPSAPAAPAVPVEGNGPAVTVTPAAKKDESPKVPE
ncbi:preprotein translocase subunit SecG [Stenotrophobium rhamnosiphilum]|uniref:Protein-export membrane protein SecG n=1 Tax=Stenotrophobium rhamnosiphilum TaxID=2029166 RepID=A0A2T5MHL7_9GAMM|nr:preprotein translocase subunit SecG [Stenotrophobium rhamnosiphilum]PTU32058.1 preprotein translocase subunit SecG [Stenotrophobium rhamnosiphilum]